MAEITDRDDLVQKMNDAVTTAMKFYSFKEMYRWNVAADFEWAIKQVKPQVTEDEVKKFLQSIPTMNGYIELKNFFNAMKDEVVDKCQEFANGTPIDAISMEPPYQSSGATAQSISGSMIELQGGQVPLFHFMIEASVSGNYRFIHFGLPQSWEKWVDNIKVSGKPGHEGDKYLFIPWSEIKYFSSPDFRRAAKSLQQTQAKQPTGRGIVRKLYDESSNEYTSTYYKLIGKPITPRPFIPAIMKYMWDSKFMVLYEIIKQHLMKQMAMQFLRGR